MRGDRGVRATARVLKPDGIRLAGCARTGYVRRVLARIPRLRDIAERIAALPRQEVVRNALECVDYDDFLRRLPGAE